MNTPVFMILPSLACQASCKYCFGPHKGEVMTMDTARETVRFVRAIAEETDATRVSVIFHGGEPLLAPLPVWRALLGGLKQELEGYETSFSLQSNLWNLTDEYLSLFKEYSVSIGTSLDGPKELCDINRGNGYFEHTFSSVNKAQQAGMPVSAIATVTRQTLPFVRDILTFFRDRELAPVLHAAVDAMENRNSPYALSPEEYAGMITGLFPWYVAHRRDMQVETLDRFVRAIVLGDPGVCTFRDCFGIFLAISPTGDITSCQRLAGKKEFTLGNIADHPTFAMLCESPAALAHKARQERVERACTDCRFYPICKGGCYYNSLAAGKDIDPLCEAYKAIYGFVEQRLAEEVSLPENMEQLRRRPTEDGKHPLLRIGRYTSLGYEPHPFRVADNARMILAVYALGAYPDARTAAEALWRDRICGDLENTRQVLEKMKRDLLINRTRRNNCYIHVTLNCNLRCSHCYASAGEETAEMPLYRLARLVDEAIAAGFRQVVFTGGEPLVHSQRDGLIALCRARRGKGTNLILRTNLYGTLSDECLMFLAEAFDQVVVSVDGDEASHDARRGKGSYASTVANLERYGSIAADIKGSAELSLACVMRADDINGVPGESVRRLGQRLGVRRVRFRPLLPIGRAQHSEEKVICEGLMEHESSEERLRIPAHPIATCGIGQNIFIKPSGRSYPCYAWCEEHVYLGNVCVSSLVSVLDSEKFKTLLTCSVDTMEKCRDCAYRYLCGGACRAWGNSAAASVNVAPPDCTHLRERAEKLVHAARNYLIQDTEVTE